MNRILILFLILVLIVGGLLFAVYRLIEISEIPSTSMSEKYMIEKIYYSYDNGENYFYAGRFVDEKYDNVCYIVNTNVSCVPIHGE